MCLALQAQKGGNVTTPAVEASPSARLTPLPSSQAFPPSTERAELFLLPTRSERARTMANPGGEQLLLKNYQDWFHLFLEGCFRHCLACRCLDSHLRPQKLHLGMSWDEILAHGAAETLIIPPRFTGHTCHVCKDKLLAYPLGQQGSQQLRGSRTALESPHCSSPELSQ